MSSSNTQAKQPVGDVDKVGHEDVQVAEAVEFESYRGDRLSVDDAEDRVEDHHPVEEGSGELLHDEEYEGSVGGEDEEDGDALHRPEVAAHGGGEAHRVRTPWFSGLQVDGVL